ncbi:MAG: hypothetical protein RRY42_04430, partial [Mucinivorans sp.]
QKFLTLDNLKCDLFHYSDQSLLGATRPNPAGAQRLLIAGSNENLGVAARPLCVRLTKNYSNKTYF